MAEKEVIFEATIDVSAALEDSKALTEEVALLKAQTKKAKEEQGEFSKEFIQYNAALKSAQKEQRVQNNLIEKSITANNAAEGSIDQLRSQLAVTSVQWAKLSKEERKNTDEGKALAKQKLDLTNALKEEEESTGDARRSVGDYGKGLNEATNATSQFVPAAGQATGAAKALGGALKVMLGPLGLVIAAIAAVVNYFKSSEEGQNKLAKATAVFNVVLGNLSDVLSSVGKAIVDAFTKPQESLDKLKARVQQIGDFFKNTFGNIIGGAIEGFVARLLKGFAGIGLAWQKLKGVFTDNAEGINKAQEEIEGLNDRIEESNERIKNGAASLGDSIKAGWDKAKEGLSGFIAEQEREIDIAKRLADQQAALDKQIRDNLVLEAQDRLKLEQLKNQIELKNQTTAEERLALLEEEDKILDDILQRSLDIATQKLEIQQAQNALSNSTKEDLQAEAELRAEIFNIEAALEGQRREAITKRQEAEREILANAEAQASEEIRILKEKIALQRELEEEERDRKAEQAAVDFENDLAIAEGNLFATLDLERQFLEQKRQQEIDAALKTGADINKINKKFAKAQRTLDSAEVNAKITLFAAATAGLAQIAGEQTAVGKAAAIASATISTIQGGISAFTGMIQTVPGPVGIALGAIAAGGVLASGYAQVKEILNVKSGLPGEGSGGGSSIPSASAPSVAVPSVRSSSSNPEIGAGIVSRDAEDVNTQSVANGVSEALQENPMSPVLVENEVTVKQDEALEQNETSVI